MPDFPALGLQENFHMQVLTDKHTKLEGRQPLSCEPARLPVASHKGCLHDNGAFRALVPMTMRSPPNCATASHVVVQIIRLLALIGWVKWVSTSMKPASFQTQNMHQLLCQARPLWEVWLGESLILIRDREPPPPCHRLLSDKGPRSVLLPFCVATCYRVVVSSLILLLTPFDLLFGC